MQKIRVLVANRPRLMKDLVLATIGDQPDIEVVGETQDEAEITELVERTRPDYLIIALENPEVRPGLSGFLLGRYPEMKILALAAERNSGIFYWAFVDIRSMHCRIIRAGHLRCFAKQAGVSWNLDARMRITNRTGSEGEGVTHNEVAVQREFSRSRSRKPLALASPRLRALTGVWIPRWL